MSFAILGSYQVLDLAYRVIFFSKAKEKLGHWMSNILEKFLISRDTWKSFWNVN